MGFFCMVKQFGAYLSPDDNSLFKSRLHFQHFSLMGCFSLGDRIELLLNWQMVTPHRLHEMRNSFFLECAVVGGIKFAASPGMSTLNCSIFRH